MIRYIPIESAYIVLKDRFVHVELVKEKDNRWSVGVPALAGCFAWGRTRADALRNIASAFDGYIQKHKRPAI